MAKFGQRISGTPAEDDLQARAAAANRRRLIRIYFFGLAASLWFSLLVVRLWDFQVRQTDRLTAKAANQQEGEVDIRADRGMIYDRTGAELALSTPVQSIGVFPKRIANPQVAAGMLADILQIDEAELRRKFTSRRFQWVKRLANPTEVERVRQLGIKALHFEEEGKRYYPKGSVAAQVIGAVGVDHDGQSGLEFYFDKQLRGTDGVGLLQYDARRQYYKRQELRAPISGDNLLLTLDLRIQSLAELELKRAVTSSLSRAGTIVLMRPESGEILAMANWPPFDPNRIARTQQDLEKRKNFAVSHMIEPGSTFKIVTAAAAIEEGAANPNDVFDCEMGGINIGRRRIRDHKPFGLLTLADVLAKSSNVGIIKVGMRVGSDTMHRYLTRFGFGRFTNITLPGETGGLVRPLNRWHSDSLASVSMGQEVGVTALQMARLFAVVANDGYLVQPRIVAAVRDHRGVTTPFEHASKVRVLSSNTATTMRAILERVVASGTGRLAQIPGYRVAGKTGTAQMINPQTRSYKDGTYVASFCGFAPVNDPAVVGVIVLDAPQGREYYGGRISAPVFPRVVQQALRYLDVAPGHSQDRKVGRPPKIPDHLLADFIAEDEAEGLATDADGHILVASQGAAGGRAAPAADSGDSPQESKVAVRVTDLTAPDFRGMSMREVLKLATKMGIALDVEGHGLVLHQSPSPDTPLTRGSVVKVLLARALPARSTQPAAAARNAETSGGG